MTRPAPAAAPEDPTTWHDEDLVSAADIAVRLGLSSKQVVLDWRYHPAEFPHPVTRRSVLYWRWRAVAEWARAHPRHVANFQREAD